MRLFELIIENPDVDGVFALSLVDEPAIDSHGLFFNRDDVRFAETKEEGLFVAPILIPNKTILRVGADGLPYEVYLSTETVQKLAHMYLKNKYQDSFTIQHDEKIDNIHLVESWITDSATKDKSKMYGLSVPAGTWMGLMSIESEELREKFRSGEVSAISIEGIFQHLEKSSKERKQSAMLMESYSDFMDKDVEELSEVEADLVIEKIKEAIFNKEHLETTKLSYIDELDEEEAKDLLNNIHSMLMPEIEMEGEPSIVSSYPGEVSSGSISPDTL